MGWPSPVVGTLAKVLSSLSWDQRSHGIAKPSPIAFSCTCQGIKFAAARFDNQSATDLSRDRGGLLRLRLEVATLSHRLRCSRTIKMKYLYFLLALITIGLLYETGRTTTVRAIARFLFILLVIAFIAVLILACTGKAQC
jgi:hypothetical protein